VPRGNMSKCFGQTVLLSVLLLTHIFTGRAGNDFGVLAGRVVDRETRSPVPGAYVLLEGTSFGTLSGADGYFRVKDLPPGSYRVHVRIPGYNPEQADVQLSTDKEQLLVFELSEMAYQLNPVTVTATREPSLVTEVPSSVDVVPLSVLRQRSMNNVSEAVETLPGVFTNNYGGLGDIKTVSLRGSSSAQVLILLDGQRLNTAQAPELDLGSIPVEGVERIEIIRGGASALYGADAMGGVINVVTRSKPDVATQRVRVSTSAGSFGTRGLGINGTYAGERFSSFFSYKYLRSDGDFLYDAPQGNEVRRRNADMLSNSLFAKGTWRSGEDDVSRLFSLSGEHYSSRAGSPGTVEYLSPLARLENQRQSVNFLYEQTGGEMLTGLRLQSYVHTMQLRYDDPEAFVPLHSLDKNTAWGAEAQGKVTVNPWSITTVGYTFRADHLAGSSSLGAQRRSQHGLYLQNELSMLFPELVFPRKILLVPAIRWDSFSDFLGQFSPKIGLLVVAGEEWRASFKANVGASFRAPSFNDLYWPSDGFSAGNPDLKPERGTDFDMGFLIRHPAWGGLGAEVTYFLNSFSDLILWQPGVADVWSPQNVGKARIRGIEIRLSFAPAQELLRFEWNYTFLDARNRTDNASEFDLLLPYRPRHVHNFSATIELSGAYCTVNLSHVAKRFTTTSNTASLPGYRLTNILLGIRRAFEPLALGVKLEMRNLEDVRYQVMPGYPMPGREVRLSLESEVFRAGGSE
jgi:outer membrane cobalamin receptor